VRASGQLPQRRDAVLESALRWYENLARRTVVRCVFDLFWYEMLH
jgi:hypothetical protein